MRPIVRIAVALAMVVCAVLAVAYGAAAASAATISVPAGTADSNAACGASPCPNLRSAVAYANANPGTTISLATGTYSLSLGELDVTQNATIAGQGMSATKVEQTDGVDRVLEIGTGPAVTLRALEITGGTANVPTTAVDASDVGGGGILDQGSQLTLDHVLLDHNGVVGANGTHSGPSGAGADAYGGGIDLPYHPPGLGTRALTITNSTISDNTGQGGTGGNTTSEGFGADGGSGGGALGGGIYAGQHTTVDVTDTTLSGNRAVGGAGGADLVTPATNGPANAGLGGNASGGAISTGYGPTNLVRDTLSANSAVGGAPGGDIYSAAHVGTGGDGEGGAFGPGEGVSGMSALYVENSTLTGNTAAGGAAVGTVNAGVAGSGYGGALQLLPVSLNGKVTIYSSTIVGNAATGDVGGGTGTGGGNIDMFGTKLDLQGTIIAGGSAAGSTGNCRIRASSPATAIVDEGNNLESSTPSQCGLSPANNDVLGGDPKVQPLAANGGPTQTLALGAGSAALNAGGACFVNVDQRSLPRPSSNCDIGAFQHQGSVVKTADAKVSGTPVVGHTLTCTGAMFAGDGLTISYTWLRSGNAISGATTPTYTLVSADAGAKLSCRVTATGAAGSATSTSAPVTVGSPGGPGGGGGAVPSFPSQKLITAADGSVKVTVSCSSGASACTGTAELTVTKVGNAYVASTNARHAKRKIIVITSSRPFTIKAGHKGTIKLHLTKLGRGLLHSRPRGLAVTLRIVKHSKTLTSKRATLKTTPRSRHH